MLDFELNLNNLNEKIRLLKSSSQVNDQYASKWNSIVHVLQHNAGLKVAEIGRGGSRGKLTDTKTSDMDLIFCLAEDKSRTQVYPDLALLFKGFFGEIADVNIGPNAIHVNFKNDIEFDVVLFSKKEYDENRKAIQEVKELTDNQHNAIRLIKYGLTKYEIPIKGFQIEHVILNLKDLPDDTVETILTHAMSQINSDLGYYGKRKRDIMNHIQNPVI